MKKYMAGPQYEFWCSQIKQGRKNPKGHRWTTKEKAFALTLFHASPKCYKLLRKTVKLPSIRTLQNLMSNVNLHPGFNQPILNAIKKKTEKMSPTEKLCVVITDEMTIKSSLVYAEHKDRVEGLQDLGRNNRTSSAANHASVFLVRGITNKWKQMFGYFFTASTIQAARLRSLILEAVEVLKSAGLLPVVFLCDQGSNNRSALSQLGVEADHPYFLAGNSTVYAMYDPPHLLKNTRNNFISGYVLNEKNISWDFVIDLHKYDEKRNIKMCHKLTYRHVYPPPFAKMKVNLAAQTLSHSVAAAMETLLELDIWSDERKEDARETAKFIENMDCLFNTFNSKRLKCSHPLKGGKFPK